MRVLAAVYVDGELDRYLGVRQEGASYSVVALRWLARPERRFWGLPSVAAAVAAVREAEVLAGTQVEWLDPEAERAWDEEATLAADQPAGLAGDLSRRGCEHGSDEQRKRRSG